MRVRPAANGNPVPAMFRQADFHPADVLILLEKMSAEQDAKRLGIRAELLPGQDVDRVLDRIRCHHEP